MKNGLNDIMDDKKNNSFYAQVKKYNKLLWIWLACFDILLCFYAGNIAISGILLYLHSSHEYREAIEALLEIAGVVIISPITLACLAVEAITGKSIMRLFLIYAIISVIVLFSPLMPLYSLYSLFLLPFYLGLALFGMICLKACIIFFPAVIIYTIIKNHLFVKPPSFIKFLNKNHAMNLLARFSLILCCAVVIYDDYNPNNLIGYINKYTPRNFFGYTTKEEMSPYIGDMDSNLKGIYEEINNLVEGLRPEFCAHF
jgi:hypothetical protein